MRARYRYSNGIDVGEVTFKRPMRKPHTGMWEVRYPGEAWQPYIFGLEEASESDDWPTRWRKGEGTLADQFSEPQEQPEPVEEGDSKYELSLKDLDYAEIGRAAIAAVNLIRTRYYRAKVWEFIQGEPFGWVRDSFDRGDLWRLRRADEELEVAIRHLIGLSLTKGESK